MRNNKEAGDYGEDLAARFLEKKGYDILESKYRRKTGEIDIICKYKSTIAFVEVKYRTSLAFGRPGEAVDYNKRNKIKKTALFYISQTQVADMDLRFDVIEIIDDGELEINHIENAFY